MTAEQTAIKDEQHQLDAMFHRRDQLLGEARGVLRELHRSRPESWHEHEEQQARLTRAHRRRAELEGAEAGLCFGRIDHADGRHQHVGRIGLPAAEADADPMLLDWRAPAARVFYTATGARPHGLCGRRHIRTEGRRVVGVDDELLGVGAHRIADGDLVGEAALLTALEGRRSGRMGDVVATLQTEQDEVIRAPEHGCLVVQGGPGTGKTAVALHRAAYLLFTHPHLVERGVLVVGPSEAFLRYIERVLPSLGETQVRTTTAAGLVPDVATVPATPEVAELKGRAGWADTLAALVAGHRPAPAALTFRVDGEDVVLPEPVVADAIRGATAGGRGHAATGAAVGDRLLDLLAEAVADRTAALLAEAERGFEDVLGAVDRNLAGDDTVGPRTAASSLDVDGVATAADVDHLRERLAADPAVSRVLDAFWPSLDPAGLLSGLLATGPLLATLAPHLTAAERLMLRARPGEGFDTADVPLLDELAELVGPAPLAHGHVVVDEAQELTPMEWRMLLRRCPTRSFTVVGDVNQTEARGGARTWAEALDPLFGDRWRQADLTISYRTPRETLDRTAPVLEAAGSPVPPPRAVRTGGPQPWRRDVAEAELPGAVATAAAELAARYEGGQIAVIAPAGRLAGLAHVESAGVRLLTPAGSKGLEFDAVVVVDPHTVAAAPRGWNALYVAMTRCTQELAVLATAPGPPPLDWE